MAVRPPGQTDLYIYMDHHMLENFDTQKDLSRWQVCWMELMSQFDMSIMYIKGEDNMVADALSCLPPDSLPITDGEPRVPLTNWATWAHASSVNAILMVDADSKFLCLIEDGYQTDEFCKKLIAFLASTPCAQESNGLWYIDSHLLIPCSGTCCEDLFCLAHDTLGHFGTDKAYASLRDSYYWPNMRHDLCKLYIPSCIDCQCNKSHTTKPAGPLHPLPVPES
jgi:hypothetical protein